MTKINFYPALAVFLLILAVSCEYNNEALEVDAADPQLHLSNGMLYYKGMVFTGVLSSTYDNGNKRSAVHYTQGRKNGDETRWYPDGNIEASRVYSKGNKVGTHQGWWPNGQLKFIYEFNRHGEYNGSVTEWYFSGQKFMDFHYLDGKEEGSQKLWQEDGRIKANYVVKNGERFGLIGLKKCDPVQIQNNNVN